MRASARSPTSHLLEDKTLKPESFSHSCFREYCRVSADLVIIDPQGLSGVELEPYEVTVEHLFARSSRVIKSFTETIALWGHPKHVSSSAYDRFLFACLFNRVLFREGECRATENRRRKKPETHEQRGIRAT